MECLTLSPNARARENLGAAGNWQKLGTTRPSVRGPSLPGAAGRAGVHRADVVAERAGQEVIPRAILSDDRHALTRGVVVARVTRVAVGGTSIDAGRFRDGNDDDRDQEHDGEQSTLGHGYLGLLGMGEHRFGRPYLLLRIFHDLQTLEEGSGFFGWSA
ncbi:MAG: hypothetical protein UT75_C0004G0002 [Candidatus Yanofskybacteria bacterium GW2011_GWE2_40_11]|uniref:Uncharacterized protein n=1 Tax=Candidatus Yanofskybacteria bacterium GW2011_GWE2_40_11 TaxID=1619033 RepID=A0A0G0QTY6_9BACT|nr:MAG: hypothetical protein UT75_C0004G0002 [Candidatus Yanofskybacteria bacterium GW2011_GWE2_40_11]